jgi:Ser/Thr protein kinase RdoA (MazF antagonist)
VPVTVNDGVRYASIVEWLNGSTLYEMDQQDQAPDFLTKTLSTLGEVIAQLHNHAESWQPSPSFTRHRLDCDGFFGPEPRWGRYWEAPLMRPDQRAILDESRDGIIAQLQSLGSSPEVFGMMHTDLHDENVFICDGGDLYLIDFDDAGFSWYLYDIAVALQSYLGRKDFEELKAAIVDGYRRQRALSTAHADLVPLFLHIRARATIGWASARPELDNAERILRLIEKTCNEAHQFS